MLTPVKQFELINRLVNTMGNTVAAAAAVGVHVSTLHRWRANTRELRGPSLAAVRAVLDHPENFAEFKKLVRPAHRPKG